MISATLKVSLTGQRTGRTSWRGRSTTSGGWCLCCTCSGLPTTRSQTRSSRAAVKEPPHTTTTIPPIVPNRRPHTSRIGRTTTASWAAARALPLLLCWIAITKAPPKLGRVSRSRKLTTTLTLSFVEKANMVTTTALAIVLWKLLRLSQFNRRVINRLRIAGLKIMRLVKLAIPSSKKAILSSSQHWQSRASSRPIGR